jgi:acetyl-CoA synthetase
MSKLTKIPPSPSFVAEAHVGSANLREALLQTSLTQPEAFWAELARAIRFSKPFERTLEWKLPKARWFEGGKLNVSENCLDRHLAKNGDRVAILWEGEPRSGLRSEPKPGDKGHQRKVSYKELHALTCRIANALAAQGIKKGDRVLIYMPMLPETVATMQACARIGAVHTVVFGGFSAQAIADRLADSGAQAIVTADGTWRKGKFLQLKPIVDEALTKGGHAVQKVLVYRRDPSQPCVMTPGRDLSWEESVLSQKPECTPVQLDSEDPLFILYTSGTTGKPKGLYHTQAGYLLWAHWTTRWLFDLQDDDLYWCTADCGWITGHTYVAYGPLSNGASQFMYEGAPTHPAPDRFWDMIERHSITKLYTSPTAIRMFMGLGDGHPKKHDLSSLRLLGTVGEPINPEAWLWFHEKIGGGRCPIVDTYWQTETGGAMIAPFPGAVDTKPGSATFPLPGVELEIRDPQTGQALPAGNKGALVFKRPWPAMARGIWGDEARFEKTYWRATPATEGVYFTGDLASIDADGYVWVEGRMDDVLNVSGHRIGTAEVESALVTHPDIYEAAAVGIPDSIKGQALVVFVEITQVAREAIEAGTKSIEALKAEAREQVGREIGSFAKPDQVRVARALPKTRSGKIMRRLLRELAATGEMKGDTTTLEDFAKDSLIED